MHAESALDLQPDYTIAQVGLAEAMLLTGNFEEGWKAYETRSRHKGWEILNPHVANKSNWNGERFINKR